MKLDRWAAVLLSALIALAVVAWFLFLRPSGRARLTAASPSAPRLVAPADRHALPALTGQVLTPPPDRLMLGSGARPALIDVWASWCVACQEEAPMLAALERRYRGRVRFLGLNVQDTRARAAAFEQRFGLGFPSVFDQNAGMATKLGVVGLPTTFLVDRTGRIAVVLIGRQQRRPLERLLAALLGASHAGAHP